METLELIRGLGESMRCMYSVVGAYTRFGESVREELKDARSPASSPRASKRWMRARTMVGAILKRRETIKRKTIEQRRRLHQQAIAA